MTAASYDACWTLWIGSNVPLISGESNDCPADSNGGSNYSLSGLSNDEVGVFIGNGKIGMLTSFDRIDTEENIITGELQYSNGVFRTNTRPLFHTGHCKFMSLDTADVQQTLVMQKINMQFGIATSVWDIAPAAAQSNDASIRVEVDQYAVRQFPFCTMTTLRIVPASNLDELVFYHEPYIEEGFASDVLFNNNVVFNEVTNGSIYVLNGVGTERGSSGSSESKVTFASTYLFEGGTSAYENQGFNVFRSDPNRCTNKFVLKSLQAGQAYRMHILTASMTSFDYDNPLEEVKRILINITSRDPTPTGVATTVVRRKHVSEWAALWASNVSLEPKTIITEQEMQTVQGLRKHLRYSLYNIYASVREMVINDVNPANTSVIDRAGNVLFQGDLWLVPLLVMLKPDVARSMLEHRYSTLQAAIQLAAGYGYKGSKYPYVNDVLGYKNALYWDTVSPQHVFNSALIAVHVWNYYRVTLDNEWLRSKGYPIIKNVADFFVSLVVLDEETGTVYNTEGLNGLLRQGKNNAFTNMLIRLTLRYALEASYELSYNPRQEWTTVYHLIVVPYHNEINYDVLKLDDAATTSASETYALLEPLILLVPLYSFLFFAEDPSCFNVESIVRNLQFYEPRLDDSLADHPYNDALLSMLNGIVLQSQTTETSVSTYMAKFYQYLDALARDHTVGVWGNFRMLGSSGDSKSNDITLSALYVLVFLLSVCGVNIKGGVSETKFYYEEMKLVHNAYAKMPSTWSQIQVKGLGGKSTAFNVTNSEIYTLP